LLSALVEHARKESELRVVMDHYRLDPAALRRHNVQPRDLVAAQWTTGDLPL